MNAAAHQVTGSIIDESMAGNGVLSRESTGDNVQFEMSAVLGAGMSGVQVRFILNTDGFCL